MVPAQWHNTADHGVMEHAIENNSVTSAQKPANTHRQRRPYEELIKALRICKGFPSTVSSKFCAFITPQPFYGPFSGTTRVSRCQKRTSGLHGAREGYQRQTHQLSAWAPLHPDWPVLTFTIPFLQAGCSSCRPTNSVKALKATSAFGLGRRR